MRTKEELLSAPQRGELEVLHHVVGLYIIPNGEKHDSGWGCMTYVAEMRVGDHCIKLVRCNGLSDHLLIRGMEHISMDCTWPDGVVHLHRHGSEMKLDVDLSSVFLYEEDGD